MVLSAYDQVGEFLEGFPIAEEAGHADEQVPNQLLDLVGMVAQERQVLGDAVELIEPQAPLDAAQQHPLAVGPEIETATRPQQGQ
jgi:hypothetical protein